MNEGGENDVLPFPRRAPFFLGVRTQGISYQVLEKKIELTSNTDNCAPLRFFSHPQQVVRCHVADGEAEILLLSNWHVRMLISQARLPPVPSDRKDMLMSISTTVQYWASACSGVDQASMASKSRNNLV